MIRQWYSVRLIIVVFSFHIGQMYEIQSSFYLFLTDKNGMVPIFSLLFGSFRLRSGVLPVFIVRLPDRLP